MYVRIPLPTLGAGRCPHRRSGGLRRATISPQRTAGSALSRFATRPAKLDHHASWMKPNLLTTSLLYVSDTFPKVVNVYTYPTLKYVGRLTGFQYPLGECA